VVVFGVDVELFIFDEFILGLDLLMEEVFNDCVVECMVVGVIVFFLVICLVRLSVL